MAAQVGRQTTLTWGSDSPPAGIAGIKEKSLTASNEAIDITSDDDSGWRTLLSTPGQKQVEWKISGVSKDEDLLADWFSSGLTQPVVATRASGAVVSGSFFLSEYSEKSNFKDAVAFDATLMSTGVITFTPAA